jgi:hypothetical protein
MTTGQGGAISLTLKYLKSTSVAVSHLNVVIGPPQLMIWSGAPPHSVPSVPNHLYLHSHQLLQSFHYYLCQATIPFFSEVIPYPF